MSEKKDKFELDVADDLMAAALAAVDARMKPAKPDTDEMDAFAQDLDIDVSVGDHREMDEVQIDLSDGVDDPDDDDPEELEKEYSHGDSDEITFLNVECDRLTRELQTSQDAAAAMKDQVDSALSQLRNQVSRSERNREKRRRLTSDVTNAAEARDAAETRVKALRETVDKLQSDLQLSLERRRRDLKDQREQDLQKIVSSFLPVVDHLQLALDHAAADPDTLMQGVRMVMGQFIKSIVSHGVMPIPSNPGTIFDPHLHEAVEMVEDAEWEANTIVSTAQVGYQFKGRLIRASRVVVSKTVQCAEDVIEDDEMGEEPFETPIDESEASEGEVTPTDPVPDEDKALDYEAESVPETAEDDEIEEELEADES